MGSEISKAIAAKFDYFCSETDDFPHSGYIDRWSQKVADFLTAAVGAHEAESFVNIGRSGDWKLDDAWKVLDMRVAYLRGFTVKPPDPSNIETTLDIIPTSNQIPKTTMDHNTKNVVLSQDELRARAIRFYGRYGKELEQIAELLQIKIKQLAFAYTLNNHLPSEAVKITTRVKSLESFLKKLEKDGWPTFYYPTEVVKDLIGARVVCWFVDDCYGVLDFIKNSNHFSVANEQTHPVKDFIETPQKAGYRAVHVFADVTYDSVQKVEGVVTVKPDQILCEIQIRTKLQDAWGDITHEFFYKAKASGVTNEDLEMFLADVSHRLAQEDKTLMKFRDSYLRLTDEKAQKGQREGFRDDK
jgi:putative GTP pyrophosphokinase